MPKRLRYLISSLVAGAMFLLFITLPYEARYYALMVGVVVIIFCYWFGLGIIWEKSMYYKIVPVLLPLMFFLGFGLFVVLLPMSWIMSIIVSLVFGFVCYLMFLVENIFFVAIGYKTVPLSRAAYTTSLIMLLVTAFFLFDTILSFRMEFWINSIAIMASSIALFLYEYWAITIELSDDGKQLNTKAYIFVPSWIMGQLALVFSFWPVGIFKGSIFLVAVIYVISGLMQADIRDRLFKRTWVGYMWAGVAILVAMILMTRWR